MKKLNVTQMENLQGGLLDGWGVAGFACGAGLAVSGPIGWIILAPACAGIFAISIWG